MCMMKQYSLKETNTYWFISSNDNIFRLEDYFPSIKKELLSYGLDMDVLKKEKSKGDNDIQSAFVKGNTQIILLSFFPNDESSNSIVKNQTTKIESKVEIIMIIFSIVVKKPILILDI